MSGVRDGQHSAVVATESLNLVPWPTRYLKVFGMTSCVNCSSVWSSAWIRTMLGLTWRPTSFGFGVVEPPPDDDEHAARPSEAPAKIKAAATVSAPCLAARILDKSTLGKTIY